MSDKCYDSLGGAFWLDIVFRTKGLLCPKSLARLFILALILYHCYCYFFGYLGHGILLISRVALSLWVRRVLW